MLRLCLVAVAICAVASITVSPDEVQQSTVAIQFNEFQQIFNVSYPNEAEKTMRFAVFQYNMELAANQTLESPDAKFGMTKFSDRTPKEFSRLLGWRQPKRNLTKSNTLTREDIPRMNKDKVDWRNDGLVTKVKDQGQCGSCWAFGTTGVIEGAWAKAGNKLTSLSEQEFVDCDRKYDAGCEGGDQSSAMDFALEKLNGDVETEDSYPYHGVQKRCKDAKGTVGATLKSYKQISSDEDAIADAVAAYGPVTIGVDASAGWQTYKSGVMCHPHAHTLDHAVLIVGYDNTASTPYWIIKNSWAADWGENGYIYIEKGRNCNGVAKDVQAAFA